MVVAISVQEFGNNLKANMDNGATVLFFPSDSIYRAASNAYFAEYAQFYGNILMIVGTSGLVTRCYPTAGGIYVCKTG